MNNSFIIYSPVRDQLQEENGKLRRKSLQEREVNNIHGCLEEGPVMPHLLCIYSSYNCIWGLGAL